MQFDEKAPICLLPSQVHQVACGMHHTLVLGQRRLGDSSHLCVCEAARDSNTSAPSVFAFGANRRRQIGIKVPLPSSAQQNQTYAQSDPGLVVEQQQSGPMDSRRCRHRSVTADVIVPSKVWEPCLVADLQHGASPCKVCTLCLCTLAFLQFDWRYATLCMLEQSTLSCVKTWCIERK